MTKVPSVNLEKLQMSKHQVRKSPDQTTISTTLHNSGQYGKTPCTQQHVKKCQMRQNVTFCFTCTTLKLTLYFPLSTHHLWSKTYWWLRVSLYIKNSRNHIKVYLKAQYTTILQENLLKALRELTLESRSSLSWRTMFSHWYNVKL